MAGDSHNGRAVPHSLKDDRPFCLVQIKGRSKTLPYFADCVSGMV